MTRDRPPPIFDGVPVYLSWRQDRAEYMEAVKLARKDYQDALKSGDCDRITRAQRARSVILKMS